MMKLACKDMDPAIMCDFEAMGETKEEVAGKMMDHVKVAHPEKMAGMPEGDMMGMVMSKVHN